MRKRKSKSSFCQVDHLELRQLLSATIYVSAAATGATHDGLSWATAFTDLQSGLTAAAGEASSSNPVIIEVGQGTYYPTAGTDRTATFQLIDDVSIQGGYAGAGQANPDARDVTLYPTTLSGDIGTTGVNTDNSYHVVTGSGTDSTAVLDGFTITDGDADGNGRYEYRGGGIFDNAGNPIISNCTITGNTGNLGGGMYNDHDSSPMLTNCIISGNTGNSGGAMANYGSSPTLTDCTISGNTADDYGGGIENNDSSPTLTNCTLSGNTAGTSGGGIQNNDSSSLTLTNCILWGDTALFADNEINNASTNSITVAYSDIEGGFAGTGNIDANPLFVDAADGNFQIEPYSPAVDSGNNAAVPNGITTDLAGNNRFQDVPTSAHAGSGNVPIVDMGAYEAAPALVASAGGPYTVLAGQSIQLTGFGSSGVLGTLSYGWSINNDNAFTDLTGPDPTFSAAGYAAGTQIDITLRITDAGGSSTTASSTLAVVSPVIYVDASATGQNNGSSWTNALTSLTAALAQATADSGQSIDVAQGTYYPTAGTDRTATFQLIDGVAIEGGFAGQADPTAAQNPTAYPTILSGDIGTTGDNADNSYHVVTASGTDNTAVLDGFTVTDGNASANSGSNANGGGIFDNAGSPTLSDCTITGNTANTVVGAGGGMYDDSGSSPRLTNCAFSNNTAYVGGGMCNDTSSSPTLTNCTLSENTASFWGGGIYNTDSSSPALTDCTLSENTAEDGGGMFNWGASPSLTNCTLSGNTANDGSGGGMYNRASNSSPTLTNCTLAGNTATLSGGGMENFDSSPTLTNCILWGDAASLTDNEIYNNSGTPTITYSDIDQSGYAGSNIDSDPLFISSSNLRLQAGSPAIGAGNAGASGLSGVTTDLDGLPRIVNGSVDMGAYQSHYEFQNTIYVDASATGGNTGSDWADAYPSLAVTLDYAVSGETIDVAQGTYYPTAGTDRTATFQLLDNVAIEGGFAGQADPTAAQNVSAYPTILSGGIGTTGSSGYSYHVVTASGTDNTAVLDGLTITDGVSNGGDSQGGGIFDNAGSPTISDCTISGNSANLDGGGIYIGNDSSPILTNCIISGNTAIEGGGMYDKDSSPTLTNCTLSGNTANVNGGGMFNNSNASPTLVNCIFWGNTAPTNNAIGTGATGTNTVTVTYSDIDGGYAGAGNIDSDPLFVDAGSSDFQLQGASPAINAGSNAAVSGVTTDLAGNPRIADGTVDMGAYEYIVASRLVITTQPANAVAGSTMSAITVDVEDQYGDVVTSDASSVTLTGPSNAGLAGTLTEPVVNGAATFSDLSLTTAGSYTLAFGDTDNGTALTPANSDSFAIASAAAAKLAFVLEPADTNAGQTMPNFAVEVQDQYGNLITSDTSTVAIASAPAGISTSIAAVDGIAIFVGVTPDTAGTFTLSASDGSLAGATSSSFTISPAAAAKLVVTQQPGNGVAGQTMANFAIEVQDQYGNLVTSNTSTVAIASTPAGISTSIAAVDGIAIFTGLSTDTAGTYTLSASDGSLAGATSSSFTITPGAAATLVITQQPASTLAGQNIPIQVEVEDQYGNAVDGSSVTLALAGSAPSGAILAGTLTEPTADGIATFSDLSLNRAGSDYTLSASDGSLPAVTTQSFAITYAGPQLVFAAEPASAVAGGKLPAFTIDTDDTAGNIVTGGKSKITLTLSSGGKIYGSAKATVNKKTGMATFKNISLHTAGTYTLTAADSSYASGISTEFTISAGAAKKLIFDPQPQNAAAASPFNVSVELVNQYGNAVNDGSTVDLVLGAHPKTAASLSSTATISDGLADFDAVTLDTAGNYTLFASDGKLKATSEKFAVG